MSKTIPRTTNTKETPSSKPPSQSSQSSPLRALYHKYAEIVNYLIIGGLTMVVSLAVKYFLLFTFLNASNPFELQVSVIASWIAAVIFAYFTNRRFVFHSQSTKILREFATFVSARLLTLGLESLTLWFFISLLGLNTDTQVIIWTLVAQAIVIVGNYILSKLFVFKKPNTKTLDSKEPQSKDTTIKNHKKT